MDERVMKLRVGIVVLAAVIITGILIWRFGDIQLPGTSKYTIYVNFPRTPGVTVGTPVRKSGFSIGRVTNVELLDKGGVQVTADIEAGRKIWEYEVCRIGSASVLGDPVLEFFPGAVTPDPNSPILENGSEIDGEVSGNPLEILTNLETDIKSAIISLRNAGDEVKLAARNVNTAIASTEGDVPRIMQKTEKALDQLNKTLAGIDNVVGDPEIQQGLKRTFQSLPELFDKTKITLDQANLTFEGFQKMSARADRNLQNLEKFTGPLAERGPVMVEQIDGILSNVNSLTEQLDELASGFNSREGTLGKLLHDDELYDRLERTMANVEDITFRLRPILDDARVFSDKIARDPGIIGVKGALDRRTMGGGNKLPTAFDHPEAYEEPSRPLFPWLGRGDE